MERHWILIITIEIDISFDNRVSRELFHVFATSAGHYHNIITYII